MIGLEFLRRPPALESRSDVLLLPLFLPLQVTCQPKAVALNTPFYVNIKYDALFKRTVDVHVDLLNAATNTWQAGSKVTVSKRTRGDACLSIARDLPLASCQTPSCPTAA